jgi:hypothetical protein
MTILGCNDAGVQCQPVATVAQQWPTIAACDAASDKVLKRYGKVRYPMVVAVCQTAGTTALIDSEDDAVENAGNASGHPPHKVSPMAGKEDRPGLTARALALVKAAIPTREGIRSTLVIPVHFVTDTYSWVARKVAD